jgi:hypothetical protein
LLSEFIFSDRGKQTVDLVLLRDLNVLQVHRAVHTHFSIEGASQHDGRVLGETHNCLRGIDGLAIRIQVEVAKEGLQIVTL